MEPLSRVRQDLAGLRQRIRSVFGEKISLPKLMLMRSSDVAGIIEQSLTASEHLLIYAEGLETRVQQLERKR
jgi:hypothetical protein